MGRIYRVVHDEYKRDTTRPDMLTAPTSKLVTYLDHPNGWWRDNAQKEIIVRNDQSVVPALKQIALGDKTSSANSPGPLARIHALWTLEGLNAINKSTLFDAFTDPDAQVRKAAVWISEMYIKKKDEENWHTYYQQEIISGCVYPRRHIPPTARPVSRYHFTGKHRSPCS